MDKNISFIKERILQYAEFKGISKEKFIEDLGMTYGNFKGKQKLTSVNSDFLDSILSKYPNINIEWVVSGIGKMEKESNLYENKLDVYETVNENNSLAYSIQNEAKLFEDSNEPEVFWNSNNNKFLIYPDGTTYIEVIKIPFNTHVLYLNSYGDEKTLKENYSTITFKVDNIGRGNYKSFESANDGMWNGGGYDTPSGADLLGREVVKHLWINGFQKTKYGFVIVSKDAIWHKDIESTSENGKLRLTSRNPSAKPFDYPLSDVFQIFHIIKRSF